MIVACVVGCGSAAPTAMAHPAPVCGCGPFPWLPSSELVVNGDFALASGWTLVGNSGISLGHLTMTGVGAATASSTAAAALIPDTYNFAFDLTATDGNGLITVAIGGTAFTVPNSNVVGHFTGEITTLATDQLIKIGNANGNACQIDNFSVTRVG